MKEGRPLAYDNLGFHESTLTAIAVNGTNIILHFEDVKSNEGEIKVQLAISGVHSMIRDGHPVRTIAFESADAEVLSLDVAVGHLKLIVEWNDFANHKSHTTSYIFFFDSYAFSS